MCRPRFCYQKVVGISFLTTMVFSDSFLRVSYSWITSLSFDTCLVGQRKVSMGHIAHFPSIPALLTFRVTSVIWTFCSLAQLSDSHANMGLTALVRGLPSDPPHDSSRTSHCLSANASRLNGGRIRDFHPIVWRAAIRTRRHNSFFKNCAL